MKNIPKFNNKISYSKTISLALLDKVNLKNTFSKPTLSSMTVFIVLKSLENFDSPRLVASSFLLRVLTNQKPYIVRFGLFQSFKEKECDILIQVNLSKTNLHNFFFFLAYNILPFLPKNDLNFSYSKFNKSVVVFFTISNLSFIRFVEMHSAFFRWQDVLNIKLFLKANSPKEAEIFLNFSKFL